MKDENSSNKANEQDKTKKAKEELEKFQKRANCENYLHDDHGPVIIGLKEGPLQFPE